MIIHLFSVNRQHLDPRIATSFAKEIKINQEFYFLGSIDSTGKDIYDGLMSEFSDKIHYLNSSFKLYQLLVENRHNRIVIHGLSYTTLAIVALSKHPNVYWVCWGSGCSINDSIKSKLSKHIKRWIYNHFECLITLMSPDQLSLENDIKVKSKTCTLPYFIKDKQDLFPFRLDDLLNNKNVTAKVLLGNNPSSIDSYYLATKALSHLAPDLYITCMMNYSYTEGHKELALLELGRKLHNDNFQFSTEFYNILDYFYYMNNYDIYICAVEYQTGLGALNTMLKLGKKIYLTGKNLKWARQMSAIVFDYNDLFNITKDSFLKPLTKDERIHNYNLIVNNETNSTKCKWYDLLSQNNS